MTAIDDQHHVSTFALDVYFANGKTGDPRLASHLETCEHCKAYLTELEASSQTAPPAWAPPLPKKTPRFRRIVAASLGAVALAAGIAVVVRGDPESDGSYVASKGAPAAQALVRSDGRSRIWDGRSPIHAGDAIALRAGCEGFTHVTVVAPSPPGDGWSRLFEGACPSGTDPLPFTLIADNKPGEERIGVVFSHARLDDDALRVAVRHHGQANKVWVIEFVFPKVVNP